MDVTNRCEATVGWGLALLITFTPLAFGTVEMWSIAMMEWGVVTLFIVFVFGRLWDQSGTRPTFRWTGLELPLLLFIALCLAQTVPIPQSLLANLSPGSARMYTMPGLDEVIDREQTGVEKAKRDTTDNDPILHPSDLPRRPISVNVTETRVRIRSLIVFVFLFDI